MMTNLTIDSILSASLDQVSADVSPDNSGDVVILNLKDGIYFELNSTGAHVWELIQQPRSLKSVLDILLEEYEIGAQQCEIDLIALIGDMAEHGLVEIGHGTNPQTD